MITPDIPLLFLNKYFLCGSAHQNSCRHVGQSISHRDIYLHKSYAPKVVPQELLQEATDVLSKSFPNFKYNCIRYSPKTNSISFQEAPDFDTAREPRVGDYITITPGSPAKKGHSDYIWHHKWLWVDNSYKGFDVAKSWNWSKQWLNTLKETSDGNGKARWDAQLKKYGLPID